MGLRQLLGIDYFGTAWQYTDLIDWPANTEPYHKGKGRSRIPLVQNLLANHDFAQYYLDHIEHLLDTDFTPAALGRGWVSPTSRAVAARHPARRTSRRTSRHSRAVHRTAVHQRRGLPRRATNSTNCATATSSSSGIYHYARMRYDSAREQLASPASHLSGRRERHHLPGPTGTVAEGRAVTAVRDRTRSLLRLVREARLRACFPARRIGWRPAASSRPTAGTRSSSTTCARSR